MNYTERLAKVFRDSPGNWFDGRTLAGIAGNYAWRSRVSDCRTKLGMDIQNRQRRVTHMGATFVVSEYRYVSELDEPNM